MIIGQVVSRTLKLIERLEIEIVGEVSIWLADPAFAALEPDARAIKVRDYVRKTGNALRTAEANDAKKMIEAKEEP